MKIYLCDKSKINIARYFDRLLSGFDLPERESVLRFVRQEDKHLALVREFLLREVLLETFPGRTTRIEKKEHGKPVVAGMEMIDKTPCAREEYVGFDFNISHSGDLVIIAFGEKKNEETAAASLVEETAAACSMEGGLFLEGPVGIDVERLGRLADYKKILRFFSKEEQDIIRGSDDPERDFYRIWTFREAFSKLEGTGLSLYERESVPINYEDKNVIFHGEEYHFHEYAYPGYQITLCTGYKVAAPKLLIKGEEIILSHLP